MINVVITNMKDFNDARSKIEKRTGKTFIRNIVKSEKVKYKMHESMHGAFCVFLGYDNDKNEVLYISKELKKQL